MKIQSNKVEEFIKTFSSDCKGVLIYGPDSGLVTVRKQEILLKILPDYKKSLSLVTLNQSILKEKPGIIKDEFNSNFLFGSDKKVILIEDIDNSSVKTLEEIFANNIQSNNFIIVIADDLDSKSSIRKFAENNKYFASLPCYKDDINTISQLVNKKLKENNFKYDMDVVKYLTESFGGNRLIILSELDKLIIYKDRDRVLTIEDVKLCIQDNSEADINEFINNFLLLNIDKSFLELQNLYSEGIFPVSIVRSLIYYVMKLQLFKYQLQNGLTFEEITTKENIFWKQKPILQQHIKGLSMKNLNDILIILLKEECKYKGKTEFCY